MSISCAECGRTIENNHVQLGSSKYSLCADCAGSEIEVFAVGLDCDHLITRHLSTIVSLLEEMSVDIESYSITKKSMLLVKYLALPESEGF